VSLLWTLICLSWVQSMPFNSRRTMSCVYRFCCLDRIAYTSGLLLQMSHVPWSCLSVNSSVCWTHRWTVQTRMNRSPLSLKATFTLPQGDLHSLSRQRSLSLKATLILSQGNVQSPSRRPSFSLKATFNLPQGDPHSPSRQRSLSLKATFTLPQGNVHSLSRQRSISLKATLILPQGNVHSLSRQRSLSLKATFNLPQGDLHSPSRQRSLSVKATLEAATARDSIHTASHDNWQHRLVVSVGGCELLYSRRLCEIQIIMYNMEFEQYSCRPVMDVQWLGHDPVILRLLNASLNTCLRDRIPPLWTPSV